MKKLLAILFAVLAINIFAQDNNRCGVSNDDQNQWNERLIRNIEYANTHGNVSDRATIFLPVHFHLVADASGNGRFKMHKLLDALCILNQDYAEHDIQFYFSEHPNTAYGLIDRSINNDNVYANQSNSFLMKLRKHPNAINYYIAENAASNSGQQGITLGYYSPGNDWIVLRKENTAESSTISHETGHFLSLQHTFKGWEFDKEDDAQPPCFEPGDPTWPNAPALSPGGDPTEKMDGSNCTTAADKICDTPPDYNFGFCQNGCAAYNGGARDPMGVLVDPMENNFMSYFNGCSDYEFTPGQEAAMKADIESSDRNFLDNTFSPIVTSFNTPNNLLIAPINAVTVPFYDDVTLEWNAVDGANYYVVEVDRINTFATPTALEFLTQGTSINVKDLLPSKTYYWRVRPFNNYYTCAVSKSGSFKTPATSGTNDIEQVSAWSIAPNPTDGAADISVNIDAASGFNAAIRLTDISGKVIYEQKNLQIGAGNTQIRIPVQNLANGFYQVTLDNGLNREVKKLVVMK